jgi:hypothetical protein
LTRRQIVLLAALAVLAVLVIWLAMRNPKPPWLPPDAVHARFLDPDTCLSCHGPSGVLPQSAAHPVGRDCLRCHARR